MSMWLMVMAFFFCMWALLGLSGGALGSFLRLPVALELSGWRGGVLGGPPELSAASPGPPSGGSSAPGEPRGSLGTPGGSLFALRLGRGGPFFLGARLLYFEGFECALR